MPPLVWDMVKELYYIRSRPIPMKTYDSTREVWCRNIDSSYKGVAAEVDLMMKITNSVFISVGCNTVNFKYLDLNAGLGVFF